MNRKLAVLACLFALTAAPAFSQTAVEETKNLFEVSYNDAEEAVSAALGEKGISEKLKVTMYGHKNGAIYSFSQPITVEIKGMNVERVNHKWNASLLFVSNGQVVSAIPASGHFDEMIELPVLKKEIRAGDMISENDLEIRDFSLGHIRNDTVTDLSALIGKTPLHNISPSRPIKTLEIAMPTVIKKNTVVEMRYNSPGMQISTSGEAMTEGAVGDVINVRNQASKKIVRAVVADNKTVTIIAAGVETSQLTRNGYETK